jgi:aldehyde:ferredoxin oxidoreductase
MLGYWGKLLRVNLSKQTATVETIPDETFRKFFGGTGLGAEILIRETPEHCDPLSADNKLVFAVGPMQAIAAPGSGKWAVSTISPLTGIFADSSGTGRWACHFKNCGYDAMVIEGMSEKPVWLYIHDDEVEFKDASNLWGLDTHETGVVIREELDNKRINALNIGPAGEIMHPIANITCNGHSFAGRGGAGAVMGSKKLKAIYTRMHMTRTAEFYMFS